MSKIQKVEDTLNMQSNRCQGDNKTQGKTNSSKKKSSKKKIHTNSSDSEEDGNFVQMRGRIVSGRFWKSQKSRTSSVIKSRPKLSLSQRMKIREDLKRVKELSRTLEQELIQAKLEKKRRREENLRRAEENRKKSEIVQVVKNPAKIKKMRKKQLRMIEKRDVSEIIG